jgi:hypothetical protein
VKTAPRRILEGLLKDDSGVGTRLAHTKGHEENLPVRTQIQSLRVLGPLDGVLGAPTAGHPLCRFVPRSVCSGWRRLGWRILSLNPKL